MDSEVSPSRRHSMGGGKLGGLQSPKHQARSGEKNSGFPQTA